MRTRRRPELLAPAGDMEKLQMAVAYGADAVYLAGTSFGMRSFAGNFTPEELPKAVALAHEDVPAGRRADVRILRQFIERLCVRFLLRTEQQARCLQFHRATFFLEL